MFARSRSRRSRLGVFGATALLLVLTACGGGSDSTDNGGASTLRFGFVGSTDLPADELGWGIKQGIVQHILAEHGIDNIETTGFGTGPDLNEAVIGGRIDVTSSGDTPALTARGSGADTKLLSVPSYSYSIVVAKADGPASIRDLAGKKVAVVKGSTMHRFLVAVLAQENVEAQIVNINSTGDSIAALQRSEVDAVATIPYMEVVNAALKTSDIRQIATAQDYDIKSLRVNTVTESFLNGNDDFSQLWAQARTATLSDIRANSSAYYDWLAELTGSPRGDVERLYPLTTLSDESLNDENAAALGATKDFLVEQNLIRRDFDINEWTVDTPQA